MVSKKNIFAFCLTLLIAVAGYTQKPTTVSSAGKVIITATAPAIPILKRLENNPLLCIKVYVPAGKASINYQQIYFSLNEQGVKAIDKVQVFFNGNEPLFSAKNNSIAAATPANKLFSIPVDIAVKQGWNYIWISATLKENADIDSRIKLQATRLTDAAKKSYAITTKNSSYANYTGIALRKAWDDSVHSYRIPGIATTDKGTLISVYDIRYKHSGDLPANIDVGMNRSTDGGKTWEPMKNIMDMGAPT